MNINNFGQKYGYIEWKEQEGCLGHNLDRVTFVIPTIHDKRFACPLVSKQTEVLSFGMVDGESTWWGQLHDPHSETKYRPLILEVHDYHRDDKPARRKASTPPGRPGNPMTILVDRDGEIVPNLVFPIRGKAKILFLDTDWEDYGWSRLYPAIALQFTEGSCESSKLAIYKWQSFMMRNKS